MSWSDDEIKGKVLHELVRAGKFEHSHTAFENLQKGFPKDIIGRAKDNIQRLVKEGILKTKPTGYGLHISVNAEKTDAIMRYINIFLSKK